MTFAEWFCEYEWRRPHDKGSDFAGGLTQADVDRLHKLALED